MASTEFSALMASARSARYMAREAIAKARASSCMERIEASAQKAEKIRLAIEIESSTRRAAVSVIAKTKESSKPATPKAEPVAPAQQKKISFMQYYVTDGTHKAKCDYSANTLRDGRNVVTIYATTYRRDLRPIFGDATRNDTDTMTDYFCKDSVNLFEDDPLYPAALERVRINEAKRQQRREKREAKSGARH